MTGLLLLACGAALTLELAGVCVWWLASRVPDAGLPAAHESVVDAMRAGPAGLPPPGVSVMAYDYAAALPPRVIQVTNALMEAWAHGGSAPVTTREVMKYDSRARTAGATRQALQRAMRRYRLVDQAGRGLWLATAKAWELRRALQAHVPAPDEAG